MDRTAASTQDRAPSGSLYLAGIAASIAVCTIGYAILGSRGELVPGGIVGLWTLTTRLFLVAWVRADRRMHPFHSSYEFDAYLFFAWPIVLVYYCCKTRGWKGFFFGVVFFCALSLPEMVWSGWRVSQMLR